MMAHKPTVAYILVCWNNKKLLDDCIKSIMEQSYLRKRIIMVDNNSSDDSVSYVEKNYPNVEILPQDKNHAFAKGNNIGINHALTDDEVEYVALVNTDAVLDKTWTQTLVDFASKKKRGASFQTITLDYYSHSIIDSTHIYISHSGQATQGSWRRGMIEDFDVAPQKVFGCNAAAVMYSRRFIEAQPFQEFFDENMWMYLEDVDIAARATVTGWDNYVVPGARAYHMGSASSGSNPGFSLYYTFRNNLGLLVKNLPLIILFRMIPKIIRGDIDTYKVLWRTNRKKLVLVVLKARIIGFLKLPIFMIKRRKIKVEIETKYLWRLMYRGY